jgi:hypothetical protein
METITVNVFRYEELNENARQKVRENLAELINMDINLETKELFSEMLKEAGLSELAEDVRYSLSYSQGDGVAFYGGVNLREFTKAQELKIDGIENIIDDMFVTVEKSNPYYDHSKSMCVSTDINEYEEEDKKENQTVEDTMSYFEKFKAVKEIISYLERFLEDFSTKLEKKGYEIIEYREAEPQIKEMCSMNDWKFFVDGSDVINDYIEGA